MSKLTVRNLESLTQADIGKRLSGEHALYGRVKAKGDGVCVMFRWRYRFDGKVCDFTCGTWPAKSLKEIRNACESARRLLEQGKNPNESKRIARLDEKAAQVEALAEAKARVERAEALGTRITVADVFERWATIELIRRKDGGKEVRRMFAKDVLPLIGSLAVEDIRKAHVTAVTDALLTRGVTRMAKVIFSLIRQMFRFAVDRDIIEADPTAAIRKGRIGGKDVERDRVLGEDEIRDLHRRIHSAGLLASTKTAVWIALATGCRIGELLRAEWKQVRLDASEWFIPADNSKNGKPNTIYLSDFALDQFIALHKINGASPWCFPNRDGNGHVCVKTITKQLGDRQRGEAIPMPGRSSHTSALLLPGGKWTPHDLRRTAATLMTALGVLPEVAEKCLNHTEESRVKRTYQRYSYESEKREAWWLLGERLDLLTRNDDNIVTLHRPKRRNRSMKGSLTGLEANKT
jgi:integrase